VVIGERTVDTHLGNVTQSSGSANGRKLALTHRELAGNGR